MPAFIMAVSIIYTVGAVVYQVSTTLHMFLQTRKDVDQSVEYIYAEIDSLHCVLHAVSSSLTDPMIRSATAAAQENSTL